MQSSQNSSPQGPLFSPFVSNSLKVKSYLGFCFGFGKGSACYNQKYKTIIAYPRVEEIQFYNATTLQFASKRRLEEFESATCMSYDQQTETYIFGCEKGWKSTKSFIYAFRASGSWPRKVQKVKEDVQAITFMSSKYFAFSCSGSKKLDIGNLEKRKTFKFYSYDKMAWCLYQMTKRHMLLAGLVDGRMVVYCTKNLPKMKIMGLVQIDRIRGPVKSIQSAVISEKEYVITATQDKTLKIWVFKKGRMRLLKVIQTGEAIKSIVYLENYKMIVASGQSDHINFLRFPSGKLETTVILGQKDEHRLFLMKEKNMIGVVGSKSEIIEFVQLHPKDK